MSEITYTISHQLPFSHDHHSLSYSIYIVQVEKSNAFKLAYDVNLWMYGYFVLFTYVYAYTKLPHNRIICEYLCHHRVTVTDRPLQKLPWACTQAGNVLDLFSIVNFHQSTVASNKHFGFQMLTNFLGKLA